MVSLTGTLVNKFSTSSEANIPLLKLSFGKFLLKTQKYQNNKITNKNYKFLRR